MGTATTLLARLDARRTAFICVDNFTRLLRDPGDGQSLLTLIGIAVGLLIAGVLGLLVLAGGLFPDRVQAVTANAANAWVARLAADVRSAESVARAKAVIEDIGER